MFKQRQALWYVDLKQLHKSITYRCTQYSVYIPVCEDAEVWITWRRQLREKIDSVPNQCWRRDAGIVRTVARLAPRREHVVGYMIFIMFPSFVLPNENLDCTPCAVDVRVCPVVRIDDLDVVIHS
jgi:hypothetical protein